MGPGLAEFGGVRAQGVRDYVDLRDNAHVLAGGGWWAVVAEFDGPWHAWRFDRVEHHTTGPALAVPASAADQLDPGVQEPAFWSGPEAGAWTSSMTQAGYQAAVRQVHSAIRAGQVYQANICRVLSAPLATRPVASGLAQILAAGNPAPHAGVVDVPEGLALSGGARAPGAWVVSASPELGVQVRHGMITSGPIKGTAATRAGLTEKDRAENVMITDLVRNDLQRLCHPGSVMVQELLKTEDHPGLVHLVSRVRGRLRAQSLSADGARGWAHLLEATQPPGSVSGAPKLAALKVIDELEPADRGPYCGQVGWIDADAEEASLAVGIRTFWWADEQLNFGTGAGITFDSDPKDEWLETELKASRLVALASRR